MEVIRVNVRIHLFDKRKTKFLVGFLLAFSRKNCLTVNKNVLIRACPPMENGAIRFTVCPVCQDIVLYRVATEEEKNHPETLDPDIAPLFPRLKVKP